MPGGVFPRVRGDAPALGPGEGGGWPAPRFLSRSSQGKRRSGPLAHRGARPARPGRLVSRAGSPAPVPPPGRGATPGGCLHALAAFLGRRVATVSDLRAAGASLLYVLKTETCRPKTGIFVTLLPTGSSSRGLAPRKTVFFTAENRELPHARTACSTPLQPGCQPPPAASPAPP